MQLNNKDTGVSVSVAADNATKAILSNTILYTEKGIGEDFGILKSHKFTTITLKDKVSESVNFYDLILNTLKAEKFPTFELSNDIQVWQSDVKVLTRFFMDSERVIKAIKTRGAVIEDPFLDVVDSLAIEANSDKDILIKEYKDFSLIYANKIASDYESAVTTEIKKIIYADGTIDIVNAEGSITIEYKKVS